MNAVRVIEDVNAVSALKAPFNTWSPEEVLAYFQTRRHIHYFAIADAAEVTPEKIAGVLINWFDFNEEAHWLPDLDWLSNPSSDIEWAIMLHKFYYAVGLGIAYQETGNRGYAEKWQALTLGWITSVPLERLPTDVMGRRVQNWVFAHYYFVGECACDAIMPEFYQRFLMSIHQQVSYLCEHLTPARNHRTLELYTIFLVAVVFPELKNADEWLAFATKELSDNIQSDLLADGVHCELSTDYHHIVLRNFLAVKRLAVLNDIELPQQIDDGIKKALAFSVYVHKPDGMIPSLSDGDTGCFLGLLAQGYELYGCETMRYVATQGQQGIAPCSRSKAFPAGGYYILRSGWGEAATAYADERYLVFDCGDLGAGNHGHLDLLSFEMAAYGQSLIVDPGRYTYDESGETNWRVQFRGTGYHNTVVVDGKNQTRYEQYTQKFKIKGAAPEYELKAFISNRAGFDYLHGVARSHEYPVVHERKILFVKGEYWVICDVLRAKTAHHYDLLFHLAAPAQDKASLNMDTHCLTVDAPHLVMVQPQQPTVKLSIKQGYVSFTYGVKEDAPILKFTQSGADCCFYTVIYPYKTQRPSLTVTAIPVFNQEGICPPHTASYLKIDINTDELTYSDSVFIANQPGTFKAGQQSFKSAVCFQRKNIQGRLIAQFEQAFTDCSRTTSQVQGG
jgi:hypothetical protein